MTSDIECKRSWRIRLTYWISGVAVCKTDCSRTGLEVGGLIKRGTGSEVRRGSLDIHLSVELLLKAQERRSVLTKGSRDSEAQKDPLKELGKARMQRELEQRGW